MEKALLLLAGGGIGSMLRYYSYSMINAKFGGHGMLIVNVVGCFFIGLLSTMLASSNATHAQAMKYLLVVGFLGGFTSFASFGLETVQHLLDGSLHLGVFNLVISIVGGLAAVSAGVMVAR